MPRGPDQPMSESDVTSLPWESVTSSNLKEIAQEGEFLYVRFTDGGRVYRYRLPADEGYQKLLEAERDPDGSVGKAFHKLIRGRQDIEAAHILITE